MKRASWIVTLALMLPACGGESAAPPTVIPSPVGGASPSPSPSANPVPSPSPSPSPDPSPTPDPVPSPTPHPSEPPPPPPPTPLPDLIININGQSYSPDTASVKVGQKVIWKNNDTVSHTATADGGAFNTGLIAPGGQASVTMSSAGNFPYHCQVHPTMTATLNVTN